MQQKLQIPFALVVEDHPLVAESLVSCVNTCDSELEVVTAESLGAALGILALRPSPLLIITDLTLTDSRDTDTVRYLRRAAPQSSLVVFTALDDPLLRGEAMRLGAGAYLVKSTSIQPLRDAVLAIIGKRTPSHYPPPEATGTLSRLLTQEQIAVLEESAAGRSNKEIATRLNISDHIVGSHMNEILDRLAVRNRTEAVARYFQMIDQTNDHPRH